MISLIVPIYNGEKYIERGLKSIINQSIGFEKIELILVNDNSTDASLRIIQKYSEKYPNIKVINLEENHGHPGTPRNIGIDLSSANYIMFMDQDDYHEPNSCEILYNKVKKEEVDVVSARWYKHLEGEKIKGHSLEEEVKIENIKESSNLLSQPGFIWVKIFKKSLLTDNNIYFPTDGLEDVVFSSHVLLKANGIIFLKDDYTYTHYINYGSISKSGNKKYLEQLLICYYNAYDIFKNLNQLPCYKYLIEMRLGYFLDTLVESDLEEYEIIEILKKFKDFCGLVSKLGAEKRERFKLLFNLIDSEDFENVFLLLKELKKSKKYVKSNVILINKNKKLKNKNKTLIIKNKAIITKNKELKTKNKKLKTKINEISPLKGYLKYKSKNLKNKL
ncbi:MAG: glycosyltransferase family 2 protein [Methanobacteriaceae archaeon]